MTNMFTNTSLLRKSRAAAELRFRWFGRIAIGISLAFLFIMVGSIINKGKSVLISSDIAIIIDLGPNQVDPNNINQTGFDALIKDH